MKLLYIDSLGNKSLIPFFKGILNFNFLNIKLIYQLLIFYKSNLRKGSRSQKNRSNINCSNKKIYKQKGTGMARMGSKANPIRKGGGRAFPSSSSENFSQKINKKMYKIALYNIFSKLLFENRLYVVEDFFFVKPSLKIFLNKISIFNVFDFQILFLTFKIEKNFYLSSRNFSNFKIIKISKINPLFLLKFSKILISKSSINFI